MKIAADLSTVAALGEGEGCVLASRARQEGMEEQGDQGRTGTTVQRSEESNPVDKGELLGARSRNKRECQRGN